MRAFSEQQLTYAVEPRSAAVLVRIGGHQFMATRSEAIELATQIVSAVDQLKE